MLDVVLRALMVMALVGGFGIPAQAYGSSVSLGQGADVSSTPRSLDVDWNLYRDTWVDPELFRESMGPQPDYVGPLQAWTKLRAPEDVATPMSGEGFITYALELTEIPRGLLGLHVSTVTSSAKFYWVEQDGVTLLYEQGVVGQQAKDGVPWDRDWVIPLPRELASRAVLVVHASNYDKAKPGMKIAPELGPIDRLRDAEQSRVQRSWLLIGMAMIMGFYHFALFVRRREQRESMWFGLLCLGFALREATTENLFCQWAEAPNRWTWAWELRLDHMTVQLLPLLVILVLRSLLPKRFKIRWVKFFVALALVNIFQILILPTLAFTAIEPFHHLSLLVTLAYLLVEVVRAFFHKDDFSLGISLAIGIGIVTAVHDVVIANLNIPAPFLATYGCACFLLIKGYVLAVRSASIYEQNAVLSKSLEEELIRRRELEGDVQLVEEHLEGTRSELSQAQEFLIQAEKLASLGGLVASIGHELNNPIGALTLTHKDQQQKIAQIKDFLYDLFDDSQESQAMKSHFDKIFESLDELSQRGRLCTDRITDISGSLRRSSRIDSENTEFDLSEVIRDSLILTQGKLKNIAVNAEALPETLIHGRRSHLGQVFTNLLSNAADALQESSQTDGVIRVMIQTESLDTQPGVVVMVEDNGPGVPVELRDKILDPFFTTKPAGVGTGLGLSICARIIENHGGTLGIDTSEKLGGASFRVWLPVDSQS